MVGLAIAGNAAGAQRIKTWHCSGVVLIPDLPWRNPIKCLHSKAITADPQL